ncbi:Mg2+ transporter protein CorA-like/Zinc transport protein ZntB [Cladophialophora carrionii]|uniref:Mg2+ transporter protein CorA-like/Zinc transport protein ZntB n=1 Tax=Cladophialophora carrionii TaxID=86049 RepID=A0A1C1CIN1_9EURO|nr:Mg2+ transporter protein CorA-like/Zinc transport protein ZntB [Cladophialophora carrionii]
MAPHGLDPISPRPPSPQSPPRFVDGYFPQQLSPSMATDSDDRVLQLIQQLEADRKVFDKLIDALSQALKSPPDRNDPRPTETSLPSAASTSSLPVSDVARQPQQPKRRTTSLTSHSALSRHVLEQHNHSRPPKDSIYTGDGSSDSDDDESFFAQETLPPQDFSESDLIEHLQTHTWDKYSQYILQDLLQNIDLLSVGIFVKDRHHQTDANHQHADIYHVGTDGAPVRLSRGDSDEGPLASWEALKSINSNASRRQAVGRIIIVREPASSLFAALHLTMNEYFDMDSIYKILIDDHTPSKAITNGYLEKDQRRQRSIVFVFKYHTIVGEGRAPLNWQNHDDDLDPSEDHIPLTTCSSVVGLSLAGNPAYTLRRNSRKSKLVLGNVYDPFAPWHVLSIQCFPDWNSNVDAHDHNHHYCNGPDAFLATLLSEYRDAIKRFKVVHKKIQGLATPPNSSIFDSALRDELLFENNRFTYSRRYFWASQTLGLLSNEIRDMIATYKDTFTDEFWTGEHKTLFPGTKDQSPRYNNWRKKLVHTRRQFEKEMSHLEEVFQTFQDQQKQIKNLREWLFSGTSVLESREAVSMAKITVEQGYNIRLLTLVTLFYLPLSYVTGIYGMTNMPPEDSFLPFALTTVGICVPTYLLILIVNNPETFRKLLTNIGLFFTRITAIPAPKRSEKLREKILEHKMPHLEVQPEMHRSATFASLEARLSQELSQEPSLRGSQGFMQATRRMSQTITNHLHGASGRHSSQAATRMPPRLSTYPESQKGLAGGRMRSSTIKFEEPFSSPMKWRTEESQATTVRDFEKSTSNISAISPTEIPALPAVVLTSPNGSPLPSPPQRGLLRPADSRRRGRSLSPRNGGGARSLFGRLGGRLSSALPSPKSSEPGSPKETV